METLRGVGSADSVAFASERAAEAFGLSLGFDLVDLRDTSSAVAETCSALSLCLREGDLFAAERLFAFLSDLQPDRRLLLGGVLQPLFDDELAALATSPDERACFVTTGRDLLLRQRTQLVDARTRGALLSVPRDDEQVLAMQMVALLLDEVGIPAHVVEGADDDGLVRLCAQRGYGAACLATADLDGREALVVRLRRQKVSVVLAGDVVRTNPEVVAQLGAAGGASRVTGVADMLMYLRGPLTGAESVALTLAADGYTNTRMAHELGLSVSAVKARLESSYLKLGAADRAHAVAIAMRQRWIR